MSSDENSQKASRAKITSAQQILEKNPRSFIFAQLAEEYLKLGEIDKAIDICSEGLKYNPDFADGQYVLGVALFQKGEKKKAIQLFLKILKANNEHYLAKEALIRMGYKEDDITKAVGKAKPSASASEAVAYEEIMDSEEKLQMLDERADEESTQTSPEESNPEEMLEKSQKRAVPSAAGDIRSAYKGAPPKVQDETDKEGIPPWIKAILLLVIIGLGVGGYFGYRYYEEQQRGKAIAATYENAQAEMQKDGYSNYMKSMKRLKSAIEQYPQAVMLNALLGECMAKLLIDFNRANAEWQSALEAANAAFPADSLKNADILTAQSYRAFYNEKLGEAKFLIDNARTRGVLTPEMICLTGEIHAADREFDKALEAFNEAFKQNPQGVRALYQKAKVLVERKDYPEAKIALDLLLEKNPNHKRGRILQLETMLFGKINREQAKKEIVEMMQKEEGSLLQLPKAKLLFLKAYLSFEEEKFEAAENEAKLSVGLSPSDEAFYLLAKAQFNRNQFEEAKQNIRKALEINSNDRRYHAFIGRIYFLEDNKTEALNALEKAIDDETKQFDLLVMAGDAARGIKMFDKAAHYYERATFVNFNNIDLKKKLILTYIDLQNMKDAFRRIDKMLADNPDEAITYYLYGKYLLAEGEDNKARKQFQKGLKLDENNREIRLEIVRMRFRNEKYQRGYRILHSLEDVYPEDIEILSWLARIALASDATIEARRLYLKLSELQPHVVNHRLRIAHIDFLDGKQKRAKKTVDEALKKDNALAYAHILKGVIFFHEKEMKKAEAHLTEGIRLDSDNPEGHFWLGKVKLAGDDETWAKNEFEVTLECQKVHPKAFYEIGMIHFKNSAFDLAKKMLIKGLEIFELFPEQKAFSVKIYIRLGEIEIFNGRRSRGLKFVEKAMKLDPNAAEPYYIMAREGDKISRPKKVIRLLEKALSLDADLHKAHYELGLVYLAQDKKEKAIKAFQHYITQEPKGAYVSDAKAQLKMLKGK